MANSKLVSLSDPSSWATKAHVAGGGGRAAGAGAASAAPAAAEAGDAALLAGARERKGTLSLKAVHAASPAPTRRQAQAVPAAGPLPSFNPAATHFHARRVENDDKYVIKGKREALLKMIERKLSSGGLSERERKTLINAGHSPDELIAAVREAKQGGGKRSKGKKGKGGGGGGKEGATGATPLRKTILGRLGGGSGDGGSSKQNKSGEAVFGRLGGGGGGKGAGSLRAVLSGVTKAGKVKAVPMAVSAKIVSLKKEQKPKAKKDEGLSVKQRLGMALSDISKRR